MINWWDWKGGGQMIFLLMQLICYWISLSHFVDLFFFEDISSSINVKYLILDIFHNFFVLFFSHLNVGNHFELVQLVFLVDLYWSWFWDRSKERFVVICSEVAKDDSREISSLYYRFSGFFHLAGANPNPSGGTDQSLLLLPSDSK